MSAVQARIHYSFKQELQLIRDIIRDCTPPDYPYEPEEGSTEYRDKPETPREVKGEHISSYDESLINRFTEKLNERKQQLGI
jgi:hypothetical protein